MRSIKLAVVVALIFVFALSSAYGSGNLTFADTYTAGQTEEEGLFSGVVKEINPSLGYITLYFQDGSGANPNQSSRLIVTRNFTYSYEPETLRDGYRADIDDIKPGDKVFIKLDRDGYIEKISAKSYYNPVYGTVHYKMPTSLVIKRDNGSFISYNLSEAIPVYKNNRPYKISDIVSGDRIRLLVQTDGENIDIAGIDIEKMTRPVTGIYRGDVEFFNSLNTSLAVSGVQEFVNGRWEYLSKIGIQSFSYSKDYKILPPKRASGTVYFATKKDYDGVDKIVMTSFRRNSGYEATLKDNLLNINFGGNLELENTSAFIAFDQDTIAVKDGRLVDVSALNTLDSVKLSMEKALYKDEYLVNVLVSESSVNAGPVIYRGRIKSIEPHKTITVESFALLDGVSWQFTNTPKTFDIDLFTSRLIEAGGVGNIRNLNSSYVQQSVYIVAEGTKILLISTAPYADSPVAGRVISLESESNSSENEGISTAQLALSEVRVYNNESYIWSPSPNIEMDIPVHAVVIKRGLVGDFTLIKPGDDLKIIRHSQSKDGILILCN